MSSGPRRAPLAGLLLAAAVALGLAAPAATAQRVFYDTVAVAPRLALTHNRIATGDLNGDGRPDLFLAGLDLLTGQPTTNILRFTIANRSTPARGDTTFSVAYSSTVNQFGSVWGGDVLVHDLNGDGRADLVFSGANDSTSTARPVSGAATQSGGTPRTLNSVSVAEFPLPALAHARLAASGRTVAAMGRTASGALTLTLLRRSAATGTAHAATALSTGLELGALAFGDCDRDGDDDLFATGLDAAGRPRALLYRNDGGTFAETAATGVPGIFNGDALMRDLDGDGDADLALTGSAYGPFGTEGVTRVLRAENCAFTPVALAPDIEHLEGTGIATGDLEGDGRDLFVMGRLPEQPTQTFIVPIGTLAAPLAIRERLSGAGYGNLVVLDYDGDGFDDLLRVGVREQPINGSTQAVRHVVLTRARFRP